MKGKIIIVMLEVMENIAIQLMNLRLEVFLEMISFLITCALAAALVYGVRYFKLDKQIGWGFVITSLCLLSVGFMFSCLGYMEWAQETVMFGSTSIQLFFEKFLGAVMAIVCMSAGFYYLLPNIGKLQKMEMSLKEMCLLYENHNKKLEDEIVKNNELLNKTSGDADNAEVAHRRFITKVSHELRTPIHAIMGLANILLDTDLDSNQKACAQAMRCSSENLRVLIDDMFDLNDLYDGTMTLAESPFSIRSVIKELEIECKSPPSSGLQVVFEVSPDVPQYVVGDVMRVKQMVSYLLENSIRHTEKGAVKTKVSIDRSGEEEALICFRVTDTGEGIPKSKMTDIIKMFSDDVHDGEYEGEGSKNYIGLTLVKQLAKTMDGWCGVKSEEGKGASFWFRLPLPVVRLSSEKVESDVDDLDNNQNGKSESNDRVMKYINEDRKALKLSIENIRLLVVDDQPINIIIIKKILQKIGVTNIDEAHNGEEALSMLEKSKYDMVLMDCQMPIMDGYQATMKIRHKEEISSSSQMPIVALTANVTPGAREECISVGMNDYVCKPSSPETILEIIEKWVINPQMV